MSSIEHTEILDNSPKIYFPNGSIFNEMTTNTLSRVNYEHLRTNMYSIDESNQTLNLNLGDPRQIRVNTINNDNTQIDLPGNSIFERIKEFRISARGHAMLCNNQLQLSGALGYDQQKYFQVRLHRSGDILLLRKEEN